MDPIQDPGVAPGRRRASAAGVGRGGRRSKASSRRTITCWACSTRLTCPTTSAGACFSPRTRPTPRGSSPAGVQNRTPRTSRTRINDRCRRTAAETPSIPTQSGDQGRRAHYTLQTCARSGAAATVAACRASSATHAAVGAVRTHRCRGHAVRAAPQAEADEFYARLTAPEVTSRFLDGRPSHASARRWLACCGASSSSTSRYAQLGWTATRAWTRPRRRTSHAWHGRNHDWTPPQQPRRDLHARQVGVPVVRHLGPRLPLRHPRPRRPGLRQGPARPVPAGVVPAPERPAPGLRMVVRRREPAGARLEAALRVHEIERQASAAAATSTFWSECSTSCCSTSHVVGQPQGRRRATTCSQGGFLGLDNIGRLLTAARSCLPVDGVLEQSDGTAWMAM